jgi:hypothetical protein
MHPTLIGAAPIRLENVVDIFESSTVSIKPRETIRKSISQCVNRFLFQFFCHYLQVQETFFRSRRYFTKGSKGRFARGVLSFVTSTINYHNILSINSPTKSKERKCIRSDRQLSNDNVEVKKNSQHPRLMTVLFQQLRPQREVI